MDDLSLALPRLNLLNPDQIDRIHASALHILATAGVRVDSPTLRDQLARIIGASQVSPEAVKMPGEFIEWALKTAPATIEIFDRQGNQAFRLGESRPRFGIGVTSLFYQDELTDDLTPFERRHMQSMVQLGHHLPHYDVISTVGIVHDVPEETSDLFATLDMVANTTKPLVVLISEDRAFPVVLDMLEDLHGDLADNPFVIPYLNPVTPLVLNSGTLDKLQEAIRRGLPVILSNYSMAGMSTPITPAGTLAVLMAELLAGLAISQMIKPGTPVILGILPAYFDMKTMVNFYDPQSMLLNLACIEMMKHYRLPHCGSSGSGTGWGPDLLAAETYWMNQLITCLAPGGLAPFVGDTLNSKAFSPVNVVLVNEIIAQSLRLAAGLQLDDASLVLDEIIAAGPGGSFLNAKSTRSRYRSAYYTSPVYTRFSMEKWQAIGQPSADRVLREYTHQLLQELTPPTDQADLLARGEAFIANR